MAGWTEALVLGERLAFDRLIEAVDARDGESAFLGELPADEVVNFIAFFSGGGDAEYLRIGCSGHIPLDSEITFRYGKREDCLTAIGRVYEMLKETNNLNKIGHVDGLRPEQHHSTPENVGTDDSGSIWQSSIPCKLILSREAHD